MCNHYIQDDVEDHMTKLLIEEIDKDRPDRIKADYERVLREAGLMPPEYTPIWVPSGR